MGTGWQKSASLTFLTCSYIINENAVFGNHDEKEDGKSINSFKLHFSTKLQLMNLKSEDETVLIFQIQIFLWLFDAYVACLSHFRWWHGSGSNFLPEVESQVLTCLTLSHCIRPPHPQFWLVCLISGYFSNIRAERVSGPSEGRCHQNNEDSHQKW